VSGNLCGYVVRRERPVADAAITIIDGPGGHVDVAPLTDGDGWFALDDLPAGRWRLRAYGPDGATGEATVDIWDYSLSEVTIMLSESDQRHPDIWREPAGAEPDLHFERPFEPLGSGTDNTGNDDLADDEPLEPPQAAPPARRSGKRQGRTHGSVMGQVTDALTGGPVANAVVVVTDGPGPFPDTAVITDAEGVFAIAAMAPGEWALRVDADNNGHGELVVAVLSGRRVNVTIALAQ